jgi:quercetin dioxygenase-like cupin family protein
MTSVLEQTRPELTPIPGLAHATWVSGADGLSQLSIWRQTFAPGAATPRHSHDCDEVVLCLSGWGEVHTDGKAERFGSDSTVVLPAGELHQIFNVGPLPLEIVGIFASTPVPVALADGQSISLPWRS